MNVYDFDETIFTGDSEDRFFEFMFNKKGFAHYRISWNFWDKLFQKGIVEKTVSRQHQYAFLKKVKDIDKVLEEYWDSVEQYFKPWYFEVKQPDDIIASGSPEFLLVPALKRLGLKNLVGTEMDKHTGKITGHFAVGKYKPENFEKKFGFEVMDKFYSDAYSDHFLAEHAKEAYLIHDNDELTEWNEYFKQHPEKAKVGKRGW